MPDKNPNSAEYFIELARQMMPYASTLLLSTWGGVVNHITKLRKGKKKFQLRELVFDLVVSTFAGLITFYFCQAAGVGETMSAALIAISGHMGTRAIAGFEIMYRRVTNMKDSENEQI